MDFVDKIIQGNNIEVLKQIPDNTFDFCFADPPYFMQVETDKPLYRVEGTEFDGCDDEWDKFPSMDAYKEYTRQWLLEVRRVLKKDGAICVISGMQSIYEIGSVLRDLGYWVINDIIWEKANPTPNFSGSRLNNSHETLIWAAKSKKSKFTFNYKTGKYLNDGKQMGSIWRIPVCSGNERLKDEQGEKVHSTQKPEALLERVIALFTSFDDLILDPFGGSMTTGAVAKRMGRHYTLIELDEKYIKYGQDRLDNVVPTIGSVEKASFDEKPIRASMKEMVDAGYFIVGEKFIHKNGKVAILVSNDGKLSYNDNVDSMHEIAAQMMGQDRRVNAFDYLFVERGDKLVSIADIRERYRDSIIEQNALLGALLSNFNEK